jgi:hypothetical protein
LREGVLAITVAEWTRDIALILSGVAGLLHWAGDFLRLRGWRWRGLQSVSPSDLGVEGLFYDFGSDDTHLLAGDEPFVLKEDENFSVVRARLNYHFNSSY